MVGHEVQVLGRQLPLARRHVPRLVGVAAVRRRPNKRTAGTTGDQTGGSIRFGSRLREVAQTSRKITNCKLLMRQVKVIGKYAGIIHRHHCRPWLGPRHWPWPPGCTPPSPTCPGCGSWECWRRRAACRCPASPGGAGSGASSPSSSDAPTFPAPTDARKLDCRPEKYDSMTCGGVKVYLNASKLSMFEGWFHATHSTTTLLFADEVYSEGRRA